MTGAFRKRLASGQPVIVLNADHPSPSLVERIGALPVDAVFIDCEQGSPDVESVENMARAARVKGLVSLVRLFDRQDWVIERYLGRGVDGIVVPRIESADEAARVVAAVRYCLPATHAEKLVVVQVETKGALDELDALLALEGIDVLFVGPVDLAKSLGFAGDHRCPDMQAILRETIARISRAGRCAGILVDQDNVAGWIQAGARFLYEHADSFLAAGARDFARTVEAAAGETG